MQEIHEILETVFGYDYLRGYQLDIINSILEGNDTISIVPTGGGKSLCFQIPAIMSDGLTIVITPLISLMKDQTDELKKRRIKATYIASGVEQMEINYIYNHLKDYKLLYIAPERLNNKFFQDRIKNVKISYLVLDEAHTLSIWGHDFRKSYLDIRNFLNLFNYRIQVLAFTATANQKIIDDIKEILNINQAKLFQILPDRENLYYDIMKPKNKLNYLIKYLSKYRDDKILIYVLTRKKTEELGNVLKSIGFNVSIYHGGMEPEDKVRNQNDYKIGKNMVMVATNAFGMGVNITDIKRTVLYEIPISIEDLIQEWGRTARKLEMGYCTLLYDEKDIRTIEYLIDSGDDTILQKEKLHNFKALLKLCNGKNCIHQLLNEYFGYKTNICRDKCSRCIR